MANLSGYNFAYLDEQTKRMIRRAILKAVAIPGYQVPFGGREMPMPYGWGTGGIQLTASVIGESDVLKVIDQGADDTTNAVSIRNFFKRVTGVNTTERTDDATLIQTRHRIPETPLTEDQIIIFQVPIPEPLRFIEPRETETRTMHALEEYGVMQVKLYEDIARFGHIATTYAYPVKVNGRYVMDPSPIPKFDNPKMDMMPALQLFGAGREKRIYAVPPFTRVESLDFDDHPFTVQQWDEPCAICGSTHSYLDEVVLDDAGNRMFVCSDTDYCRQQSEAQKPMNQPLLSVNNLTHLYAPGKGFSDVSFDLWPGEVLGIVGESGSGKTTLLKSISARLTPQQGEIRYREPFAVRHERGRPPSPAAHRMGRGASASARRPAPPGVGRRQYRRTADGDRGASLRRHSRHRAEVAGRGGDSRLTGSTTCRPPFPAVCSSVCRLPATW